MWGYEHLHLLRRRAAHAGPVRRRIRRPRHLPAHIPQRVLRQRASGTTEEAFGLAQKHPGQAHYNRAFDPRNGEAGLERLRTTARAWELQGRQALHRRVARRLRAARSSSDPWHSGTWRSARSSGITNIHVHKGPTIRPLDRDAFDVADIDKVASDFPGLNFIVEHCRAAPARGLLLDRHPGVQRVRGPGGGDAVHPHPAPVLRPDHRRAAVLDRRGQDPVRQRLRALDTEVADREVRRLPDPRGPDRVRADHRRPEAKDPRPQRGRAVRPRRSRGAATRRAGRPRTPWRSAAGAKESGAMPVAPSVEADILAALARSSTPSWTSRSPNSASSRSVSVDDGGVDGPSAAADVLLLPELRLPDGVGRPGRTAGGARTSARFGCCWRTTTTATRSTPAWRPTPVTSARSVPRRRRVCDELRRTFLRKAHTGGHGAVRRRRLIRQDAWTPNEIHHVTLARPARGEREGRRCCAAASPSACSDVPGRRVFVDKDGRAAAGRGGAAAAAVRPFRSDLDRGQRRTSAAACCATRYDDEGGGRTAT